MTASTLSVVGTAISLHAEHAVGRGWRPATLLPVDDATSPWTAQGLVPFWMDPPGAGIGSNWAVPNDLSLDGLVLLTGPNMAGKSTVLRSAAALALLAACGLHCPVTRAEVPFFDSLVVRMSSTDSPAEGRAAAPRDPAFIHVTYGKTPSKFKKIRA